MECGYVWKRQQRKGAKCICPRCKKTLLVKDTRAYRLSERYYIAYLQRLKDYQVVRYCIVAKKADTKRGIRDVTADEVAQVWVNAQGDVTILARTRSMSFWYNDVWNLGSPLSVKREFPYLPVWDTMVCSLLPAFRQRGIKQSIFNLNPYSLLVSLAKSSQAETLFKVRYLEVLQTMMRYNFYTDLEPYEWSAVKVALRHGYRLSSQGSVREWLDMLRNLHELGKDTCNPYYICPANLGESHIHWMNAVERKRETNRRHNDEAEAEKYEAEYYQRYAKYLGLQFNQGELSVAPLPDVHSFIDEGHAMHHCVFLNRYFDRPESLIMSAKIAGQRIETVEVDLQTKRVIQSRGKFNVETPYHSRIVQLVNEQFSILTNIDL